MSSQKGYLYQQLFNAYKKCHPDIKPAKVQACVNDLWAKLKEDSKNEDTHTLEMTVKAKTEQLLENAKKKDLKLLSFFLKKPSTALKSDETRGNDKSSSGTSTQDVDSGQIQMYESVEDEVPTVSIKRSKPAQEESDKKIGILNSELNLMLLQRDSGLGSSDIDKKISNLRKELANEKKVLKRKQQAASRAVKSREAKKVKLQEICDEHPDVLKKLKLRENPGRPRVEEDQPELLKHIINIAMQGSSADERRRSETIRNCKTLDQLHNELKRLGIDISRSATYLRLLPRNSKTLEGKRHVKTVPVKLIRAQNDARKQHIDTEFATTSIRYLECLASFLGPSEVLFISQDDKARVPIGITAATKQAPLLMHMEYRVTLPDHDWVVAARHKLIPSVYAGIIIKRGGFGKREYVTYSGPTYIAIRSGKHTSSSAETHFDDIEIILNEVQSFKNLVKTPTGAIKPVCIISVDGGPDENPRYQKVIMCAIDHFKQNDLDALFVVTNAPGRSAYNRVERRMAPLSQELAGLVLPHEHYGSHLNDQGKTIDEILEKRNFEYAGMTLAEVWRGMQIDGYAVEAEYIQAKEKGDLKELEVDSWYNTHVRESQYLLQIVKCTSVQCCGPSRSSLRTLIPGGFLPPPIRVIQTDVTGLSVVPSTSQDGIFLHLLGRLACQLEPVALGFKQVPYDLFCPTVHGRLSSRVCVTCGMYHATNKNLVKHLKVMHHQNIQKDFLSTERLLRERPVRIAARRARELLCILHDEVTGEEDAEWISEEDVDSNMQESSNVTVNMDMPVIDIEQILQQNPWTNEEN